MKLRLSLWAVFAAAVISLFSLLLASQETMVLATRPSDSVIDDVYDSEGSRHPSGNDRNNEPGNSGTQGKSTSNPDGNGADKRRTSSDGSFGGTQGHGDWDDNNGCGNDNDFADDNKGNCGGKAKTGAVPSPKPSVKPSPRPSRSPRPSSTPSPGGIVNENNNENNNNNSSENTVNITIENNPTQTQTVNVTVPKVLPATGVSTLGMVTMFGAAPLGIILSRFGRGLSSKKKEDLTSIANQLFISRQTRRS